MKNTLVNNVHSEKSEKKEYQEVFARGLRRVQALRRMKTPLAKYVSQNILDASQGMRCMSVRVSVGNLPPSVPKEVVINELVARRQTDEVRAVRGPGALRLKDEVAVGLPN